MAKVRTKIARDGSIVVIKGDLTSYTPPAGYRQDSDNPNIFRPPGARVVTGPNNSTPPPNSLAARGLIPGRKNFIGNLPENKGKSVFKLMEETASKEEVKTSTPATAVLPREDIHETRDLDAERRNLTDVSKKEDSGDKKVGDSIPTGGLTTDKVDTEGQSNESSISAIKEQVQEQIGKRSGEGYEPSSSTSGTSEGSDHDMLK